MLVLDSEKFKPRSVSRVVRAALATVCPITLRQTVETISVPRNYTFQPADNRRTAQWIESQFRNAGYHVERQGEFDNLLALPTAKTKPSILVGAHYDSVAGTFGADDNASAVAAVLECARALTKAATQAPVGFVVFNREEDDLLGSRDFVENFAPLADWPLRAVHILEMVGYCDARPGSQSLPPGLPIKIRDRGDFLAILSNRDSTALVNPLLQTARTYLPDLPVTALKVFLGMEKFLPNLERSDHAPFWRARFPALMWTDTSEFRNPNYHLDSDRPETLDYDFLAKVTQLLIAQVMQA
ncbi:MAG TPA: M28 family peptidase [Chthoniobacteraceae bacterium]|nr:M28 family peptidase [Chthoniobacteraceae bacterium]